MFQNSGCDAERGSSVEDAIRAPLTSYGLDRKAVLEPHMRRANHQIGADFHYVKGQFGGEPVDKIPTIASKLVINMFNEAYGSVEPDYLLAADQYPQQAIKADEVIDVRVRDKDMFQTQNLSRRQARYVAEIKHDSPLLKQRFDIERRIARSSVDQHRM